MTMPTNSPSEMSNEELVDAFVKASNRRHATPSGWVSIGVDNKGVVKQDQGWYEPDPHQVFADIRDIILRRLNRAEGLEERVLSAVEVRIGEMCQSFVGDWEDHEYPDGTTWDSRIDEIQAAVKKAITATFADQPGGDHE